MDYHDKKWAVDWDIWHYDSDLSEKEIDAYVQKIRKALTANGNVGVVNHEGEAIALWGDANGDNAQLEKLFDELTGHGCYVEEVI